MHSATGISSPFPSFSVPPARASRHSRVALTLRIFAGCSVYRGDAAPPAPALGCQPYWQVVFLPVKKLWARHHRLGGSWRSGEAMCHGLCSLPRLCFCPAPVRDLGNYAWLIFTCSLLLFQPHFPSAAPALLEYSHLSCLCLPLHARNDPWWPALLCNALPPLLLPQPWQSSSPHGLRTCQLEFAASPPCRPCLFPALSRQGLPQTKWHSLPTTPSRDATWKIRRDLQTTSS